MSRPVYGRVYELFLHEQPEGTHSYVGKVQAPTTIHQRVWGRSSSAHTSPESVARDPWKAGILPGRAGHRQLEVVYASGDPAEDDRALRRAEAFWIDRLRTVHNEVRPVRPAGERRTAATSSARTPVTYARPRRSRRRTVKPYVLATFVLAFTFLAARVIVAMQLPWPAAPWVAAPTAGFLLGWATFWRLHRAVRKLLR